MNRTRRHILRGLAAAPAIATLGRHAFAADAPRVLKISHQFPASQGNDGDFRDRLARKFAADVEKRTNGALKCEVYPSSSLVKTFSQFGALRKGSLDMSVLPLAYGGGEVPEVNLGLMPTLVTSYEQGMRWKTAPLGKEWSKFIEDKGIKIVTWVWQAGGTASAKGQILNPEDAKGLKLRGGSKEMDLMLNAAGAAITNVPSNEIYSAMQSGVLDGAVTSSTSLISFRLQEVSKALTAGRKFTFWFMFEPLLISKAVYDSLKPEHQKAIMEVGESLEKYGMEEARKDDDRVVDIYSKAGNKVVEMDKTAFDKWRKVAEQSAFKDFAEKVKDGKRWLDMALEVK